MAPLYCERLVRSARDQCRWIAYTRCGALPAEGMREMVVALPSVRDTRLRIRHTPLLAMSSVTVHFPRKGSETTQAVHRLAVS